MPATLSKSPRFPGEGDGLPSFFTEPHPEAVGSRGDEMVAHAESRRGGPLRWWQWACAQRRYEVRADGSWCWQLVFESAGRQQGKSVDLAEDAAWYGSQTLGREEVLHAAYRVKTSLDVQAELWGWAQESGLEVRRLLGDSRIIWPNGTLWATVAMESVYGRRPFRLLVDECWAMDPVKFWNSMFPALGARVGPQVLFFSAANGQDQGLVSDLRADGSVCRMEWGALPGEAFDDEGTWRRATAFMTAGRLELMRTASTRPGFAENWLNVWPVGRVTPAIDAAVWAGAAVAGVVVPRDRSVVGLSLDSATGRWPVVAAAAVDVGVVVRMVGEAASLAGAVALAGSAAGRGCTLLVPRHALRGQVQVPGVREMMHVTEEDAHSAITLAKVTVAGGLVRHDGDAALTAAVLGVPERRVARRWDAGTLALVCAWWAAKPKPRAVVA